MDVRDATPMNAHETLGEPSFTPEAVVERAREPAAGG
jgi:hypothetical protein